MNHRCLLLFFLLGITVPWSSAQNLPDTEIRPALEYEFQTANGAAYLLEGSTNGQTWTTVAGPIFGNGGISKALLPPAAANLREFRVRPVNEADFGPATTRLGGKTIALNDGGRARQVIFFPVVQGMQRGILKTDATHARGFTWHIQRINSSAVTVELQYMDGTSSRIDLVFSNGSLGSYQLFDRNPSGVTQGTEGGGFSLHSGRIQDASARTTLPPALSGQSLILEEGGSVSRFDFAANGSVTQIRADGSTANYQYQFNPSSPQQAELRLESAGLPGQIYQMRLTTQATGTFTRQPLLPGGGFMPGILPQPGTFNVPTVPVIVNSVVGPPRTLSGKVLQISGDEPVTLTFHSDGTGTATREDNGSVEVTPFTYDYSPTDEDEASLALTYPGAQTDRVEDYNLEFDEGAVGSYNSSTYEGGEQASSSSGSFNIGGS